jgi:hypothetical protein
MGKLGGQEPPYHIPELDHIQCGLSSLSVATLPIILPALLSTS